MICNCGLNILKLNIPHSLILSFEVNFADGYNICLQKNFIELQSNEIFQERFKHGKHNIWKSNDTVKKISSTLRKSAVVYIIAYRSSYIVESCFSRVSNLLSKV